MLPLLFLFMFMASPAAAQTIRIVDNNINAPKGPNVFSTIQEAHDAADHGDIIHIIPSHVPYGDATILKQLHFYGIGFNPDRENPYLSRIGQIILDHDILVNPAGSAGSTFQGLHILSVVVYKTDVVHEIAIKNSKLNMFSSWPGMRDLLIENIIVGSSISLDHGDGGGNPDGNIIVRNNIFTKEASLNGQNMLVSNNLFLGNGQQFNNSSFQIVRDVIFTNNIFFGRKPIPYFGPDQILRCDFYFNVVFGNDDNSLPIYGSNTGANNLVGVNPDFENLAFSSLDWDFSWNPSLKSGSPALNAGSDGTDIGLFGGGAPFHSLFYGGTPLPFVRMLTTPGMILEGQNMLIEVQARGN